MKKSQAYKSFNTDKTIEELQYSIVKDTNMFENLKFELRFYKSLVTKPIFKPHVLNLYETLEKYKNEISNLHKDIEALLNELNSHEHQISNKIECEDLACDNFFIKKHETIEEKAFNLNNKIYNLKFRLLQYIESVIYN